MKISGQTKQRVWIKESTGLGYGECNINKSQCFVPELTKDMTVSKECRHMRIIR